MEIKCKLVKILDERSGTSAKGEWSKVSVLATYQDGNYSNNISLDVWGKDGEALKVSKEGTEFSGKLSVSAREYQGKWYNDLKLIFIKIGGETEPKSDWKEDKAFSEPSTIMTGTSDLLPF